MRKRKKPRKDGSSKYQQYSRQAVEDAYNAVVLHKMTVYQAAKEFKIPYMTLSDKIHGKRPLYTKLGRKSLLPEENEIKFAEHVKYLFSIGYGFAKADFLQMATEYALHLGKHNLKGQGKIGKIWYYNFLKKYPDVISVRPFSKHLCVTREVIVKYYNDLEALMEEHRFQLRPETIFIMDKVDFEFNTKLNVTIKQGSVDSSSVTGSKSTSVIFIGAGNYKGVQIPGYLVFTDNTTFDSKSAPVHFSVTEKSWLGGDVLKHYFFNTFIPCARDRVRKSKRHLLVLYDAHKFITCPGVVEWLLERNIVLFPLPPHISLYQHTKTLSVLTGFEDLYNKQMSVVKGDVSRTSLPSFVSEVSLNVYNKVTDKSSLPLVFSGLGIIPYNAFALNRPIVNTKVKQARWTESQRAKKKKKRPEMDDSESENDESDSDIYENEMRQRKRKASVASNGELVRISDQLGVRKSKRKRKKRKFSSSEEEDEEKDDDDDDDDDHGDDDDIDYNSDSQNRVVSGYIDDVSNFNIVPDESDAVELTTNIEVNENVDLEIENIDGSVWIENEQKCCACHRVDSADGAAVGDVAVVDWVHCESCPHWTHLDTCTTSGQFIEEKYYCIHCIVCDKLDEKLSEFGQNVFHSL
ncbi:uncharacterized protein LOC121370490 [Gigantopelta aegis]|uniref:uncharacterized protein LOC121370490 n=1 Tax=Gigantopelta aegis TaxID=1735272 RepID=UPI001B88DCED|nr:uncharacterized protein LOC121370490 [Gigantopelta aegis]